MTRKEIYAKVKKYNLAESIKETYGKNYTIVSSDDLLGIINNFESMTTISSNVTTPKNRRLERLIEVLTKKRILLPSEVNYINN